MDLDFDRCVRAVQSKDARFDGWFFTAVLTTRIYCKPSCPGVPPKVENMSFLPSAAAAQQAGFRACKRCRPDASPGSPQWNTRADLVGRAMRLIADGLVDREGVQGLAVRLGYSTRQVERQLRAELGAGPLALARAQRAQTARLLIETSDLPMGDVAFAAGFSSIRTFNDTVRQVFGLTPTEVRRRGRAATTPGELSFRLPFRAPLCVEPLFAWFAAAAITPMEEWHEGAYRRTLRLPHGHGIVTVRPSPDHIGCRLSLTDFRDLSTAISRCRWMLDLDADPVAVDELLSGDPALRPWVAKNPGIRVPRWPDAAEAVARTVLKRDLARMVADHGEPVHDPEGRLTHAFPDVLALAELDHEALPGPPKARVLLSEMFSALARGRIDLDPGGDWWRARAELTDVPLLTPSIVETIAMRALGDPDAFVATDPGIRAAARGLGLPGTPLGMTRHAARWRPWRAYAMQHLWIAHSIGNRPRRTRTVKAF